ncbi:hypothetical protein IQ231_02515 [Cuspidothrix issatschenkoi LEGE 03284]|uniref:hypothetical protein n=1 Tax=Cuspidothrix issatschenkoi TaxID=230752 RepID=UPI00187EF910|nr:hypothetical protein [Cuspidothrix issatschenkoi]MBE9230594.1 hypothetical protein [Cuspidothrix issatschenkoi LEGE 03284]
MPQINGNQPKLTRSIQQINLAIAKLICLAVDKLKNFNNISVFVTLLIQTNSHSLIRCFVSQKSLDQVNI